MSKYNLKTGDILLFDYEGGNIFYYYFSKLIQYVSGSNYTHVAMVLKDPSFIHPSLKGYYIWQSSWSGILDSEDNKLKFGVQINPLNEVLDYYKKNNSHASIRRINCGKNNLSNNNLESIHNIVHNKPYDIIPSDWIDGILHRDDKPQKIDRFWCSAFIGYIYTICGLLPGNTDWSIMRPSDFSDKSTITFINNSYLSKEERLF